MPERAHFGEHLIRDVEGERVGPDRGDTRDRPGVDRVLGAPGERLLQLLAVEAQMNRVGGEMPIGAGGHAVAERLDELDVVTLEAELDARARERVGLRSLALDPRFAQQQPESAALAGLLRFTPCREAPALDGTAPP